MVRKLYEYELWELDELPLISLKSDKLNKEYLKENGILLCEFKARSCYQATVIRDRYLSIGDFTSDLQPYEIWVDKSKERVKESVIILVPTARPRKDFIDLYKYKCIKVIEATNDTDGINLCRAELNLSKLPKKLKGLFS